MYDVIVVGGGIAGLSAALVLGRARRRTLVLDAGSPRNQPASHSHGFVTQDGTPPLELLERARDELTAYPSVEVRAGEAVDAAATETGYRVELRDGTAVETRKLILATGIRDVLPEVPGLQDLWGNGVYHCPYCHGWEVRDRRWAVLGGPNVQYERVALFRAWTHDLVVLTRGDTLDADVRARLEAQAVVVDERPVRAVEPDGDDVRVLFEDGSELTAGAVFASPGMVQRSELPDRLGCEMDEVAQMNARFVKVDGMSGETTVAGVYAAGDMIMQPQSLIMGAASGARAAYHVNHVMAFEDAEAAIAAALSGSGA